MSNTAKTKGVHHVAITVLDLDSTVEFFTNVLGFEKVGEDPSYPAAFVSDGTSMIALWRANSPTTAIPFDRKNTIGLHHLALAVEPSTLDQLNDTLQGTKGCAIEFAPELMYGGPSRHMMVNIPGSGIRIELRAEA